MVVVQWMHSTSQPVSVRSPSVSTRPRRFVRADPPPAPRRQTVPLPHDDERSLPDDLLAAFPSEEEQFPSRYPQDLGVPPLPEPPFIPRSPRQPPQQEPDTPESPPAPQEEGEVTQEITSADPAAAGLLRIFGGFFASTETTEPTESASPTEPGVPGTTDQPTDSTGKPAPVVTEPVLTAPKFRRAGVAIGKALEVKPNGDVKFPLRLTLSFDPAEPEAKGVSPEMISPFFFDESTGQWSTEGLTTMGVDAVAGQVKFETTHLTVFRLGVPRGRPPLIHAIQPRHLIPDQSLELLGHGFSPVASQNVLTVGGSLVSIAFDAMGMPQALNLPNEGESLSLISADGTELDRAELAAAPEPRSSWMREEDGDAEKPFVAHATPGNGRLFSPGMLASGESFHLVTNAVATPPAPGELIINEVLLTPPDSYLGDANGDGETVPQEDEFVELVNTTDHPLRLDGVSLKHHDATLAHQFPAGTILPGGLAWVVFGVEDVNDPPQPAGPFGGEHFLPEISVSHRLTARLPATTSLGTHWLTITTSRRTSNPVSLQVLSPALGPLAFQDASSQLAGITVDRPRLVRAGELTRDGALDLVMVEGSRNVVMVSNDGFGRFTQGAEPIGLPDGRTRFFDVALADLTDDGAAEIIIGDTDASGSYTQLLVLEPKSAGHVELLSSAGRLNPSIALGPTAFDIGDIDQDGDLDVVVAMIGDLPAIARNDGTGGFSFQSGDMVAQEQPVAPTSLHLADVDRDGDPDALLSAGRAGLGAANALQLFVNDGTGQFRDESSRQLPAIRDGIDTVVVGDVNGDGAQDLLLAQRPARISAVVNDGSGTFTMGASITLEAGTIHALETGDMDGDRDLDLLVTTNVGYALLFNDGTGQFSVLSGLTQPAAGVQEAVVVDVDNDGDLDLVGAGSARLSLLLNTARRTNRPPEFRPVDEQTILEGRQLRIRIRASDPDDDPVTLEATMRSGEPLSSVGASFTIRNRGAGVFEWIPNATQGLPEGKLYEFRIQASDGTATAELIVRVLVQEFNHPPTLEPLSARTVNEQVPLSIQLQASDLDEGDVLTFGATGLPTGATLNDMTGLFTWTPDATQGDGPSGMRTYTVTLTVTDSAGLSASQSLSVSVNDTVRVNRPPKFLGLIDHPIEEGKLLQFVVEVSDPDGDPLTVSLTGEPPRRATFDPLTRKFSWRPDGTQAGQYSLTFEVRDGHHVVQQTIQVIVRDVTHGPILTPIPDQPAREGDLLQFSIHASDPDGDSLTISVEPLPPGAQVTEDNQRTVFQWVPGIDQEGTYDVQVRVSDGTGIVTDAVTITVSNNPGFQQLVAQVGLSPNGGGPQDPLSDFGAIENPALTQVIPTSLGVDLGEVHPARVSLIKLFATRSVAHLTEQDIRLYVSEDNRSYRAYDGPRVFINMGRQVMFSNVNISERYLKIHFPNSGTWPNFLSESVRVFGAIPLDTTTVAFLDNLSEETFRYFAEHVNANGLIPDRVSLANGRPVPSQAYSTGATGFWLASLPIAAKHGWLTRTRAESFARRTLQRYLGIDGSPVAGQFGFFYHFVNSDGTRFMGFDGDGVSIIDSSLLFLGALAGGEYFGGDIQTLSQQLYDGVNWEAFVDHGPNQTLRAHGENQFYLVWTPEQGFERHLDYYSEGLLAYVLAAGSTTHPIRPDPNLPEGLDAYYHISRGSFGLLSGRFGRDGLPMIQSFFGSLFTYLYPSLFIEWGSGRDAFHVNWAENTREAILANFRFAQAHPEAGYRRLFWGISASDGPQGYQGLYGTPPLDAAAVGGARHDGTVTPYALAGSLPFAADLALPALQHLASVQQGALRDRYGLKDAINVAQGFVANDYLGIDQGALLLGIEQYRTGLVGRLVRDHPVLQRALNQLGVRSRPTYRLEPSGPRSAHAYLLINTTDHLTQTIEFSTPSAIAAGDALLELHPSGIDHALGKRFVDVDVALNGQLLRRVRFLDRRGTGEADVSSVYVPMPTAMLQTSGTHIITLTWADGERWVQLQDVHVNPPTGSTNQDTWQIGQVDGAFQDFGEERLADNSYLIGEDPVTFERALNVVDEPMTDVLFMLQDASADRALRLVAAQTHNQLPVTVEVSVNDGIAGQAILAAGGEATVEISHTLLRQGWNHLQLRHAAIPREGEFVVWDALAFGPSMADQTLRVLVRNVSDNQSSSTLEFGLAPPQGAVLSARQYLEIQYELGSPSEQITIATDNRHGLRHRFTGPSEASAAGLVGEVDPGIAAPLLWQVYDEVQPAAPSFTDTMEWAYVPDESDAGFATPDAIAYRTLLKGAQLGDRPTTGRAAASPVIVYLAVDFRNKPAQLYGTDRIFIERIEQ